MPHRTFRDADGREWQVWDVQPTRAERRQTERREREEARAASERRARERRGPAFDAYVRMEPMLANGWLCFLAPGERRRLAPVPASWDALSDPALEQLCERARAARPWGDWTR